MDWHRGDANNDALIDMGDIVYLINYVFRGGPAPCPLGDEGSSGDATENGIVDLGDIVYLINFVFKGGPPPSPP